ncbi:hypothetical protein NPIL_81511 [Nephila pilipes]|uniref:Uncharacterized protein n=1 Tax=Nephila pilipes TaxID=299642 RepID=A0A8X6TA04_NEPPI|nr:hypothetical protein NPIL_81511 [Nephila pilipes]
MRTFYSLFDERHTKKDSIKNKTFCPMNRIPSLDVGRRFHIRKAAKDRKYHRLYYQQWEAIGCTKNYGAISGKRLSKALPKIHLPSGYSSSNAMFGEKRRIRFSRNLIETGDPLREGELFLNCKEVSRKRS